MKTPVKIVLIIVALVAVFLIGFIPARLKFNALETANKKAENSFEAQNKLQSGKIAELQDKIQFNKIKENLVKVIIAVDRKNYGIALENFKTFINAWEEFKSNAHIKNAIQDSEIQRDEIVTDLAKSNPAAKDKLVAVLERLYSVPL
jgi:hypothetical protein